MRINQLVAQRSGLSRRSADLAIQSRRVRVNGHLPILGQQVSVDDVITLDGEQLTLTERLTVALNKPLGYVCSRNGQGSPTIYELLPNIYHKLKPVGRLDKDSSGLILLTNDGQFAVSMTHPRFVKDKVYTVSIDHALTEAHAKQLQEPGVMLSDGLSQLRLTLTNPNRRVWQVIIHTGRNRQIRRSFAQLGYKVMRLHRTQFGNYSLGTLKSGECSELKMSVI